MAEEAVGTKFETYERKHNSLEFKEVFKWIMSPLISNRLGKSVNLDGHFLINCNFSEKENAESKVYEKLVVGKL